MDICYNAVRRLVLSEWLNLHGLRSERQIDRRTRWDFIKVIRRAGLFRIRIRIYMYITQPSTLCGMVKWIWGSTPGRGAIKST